MTVSNACNVKKLMAISNGKLILDLITFMVTASVAPQTHSMPINAVFSITLPLLELIVIKRSFYCIFPAKRRALPLGDTSGKAAASF